MCLLPRLHDVNQPYFRVSHLKFNIRGRLIWHIQYCSLALPNEYSWVIQCCYMYQFICTSTAFQKACRCRDNRKKSRFSWAVQTYHLYMHMDMCRRGVTTENLAMVKSCVVFGCHSMASRRKRLRELPAVMVKGHKHAGMLPGGR